MRANGVPERLCTGAGSDWEKFQAWAQTVPLAKTMSEKISALRKWAVGRARNASTANIALVEEPQSKFAT